MANFARITPKILVWARKLNNLSRSELADKIHVNEKQIIKWEGGKTKPTFKQATDLAKTLNLPFGYLFLSEPPPLEKPLPDLRTRGDLPLAHLSLGLRDVIYGVLDIQDWYREYRLEYDAQKLPFVGTFSTAHTPQAVAENIRATLSLTPDLRESVKTLSKYLTALTEHAESVGVLVMHSSVVGNDNQRPLSADEFQGFVATDPLAPIIFINSRDYVAARIFTLTHELAHIWIGRSGILEVDEAEIPGQKTDVESFCNAVAAETLVPASEFAPAFDAYGGSLADLSNYFRVSRLVILRRAFELGHIERQEFFSRVAGLRTIREKQKKPGGRPVYLDNVGARHSFTFMDSVIKDVRVGGTLIRDAARLLHMRTPTFNRIVESGEY